MIRKYYLRSGLFLLYHKAFVWDKAPERVARVWTSFFSEGDEKAGRNLGRFYPLNLSVLWLKQTPTCTGFCLRKSPACRLSCMIEPLGYFAVGKYFTA